MTQQFDIRVVSIGNFAGGSWGHAGNPAEVYEYFRVICPRLNRESTHPSLAGLAPFTFRSRAAAEQFAREEAAREAAFQLEREAQKEQRDAEFQRQCRREIGLPDGVAPNAKFCRVNGGVRVIINGKAHAGRFTVNAQGELVAL